MIQGFNCISEQPTNHADFSALKIWDPLVHWFKSYGQKVVLDTNKLSLHNFWKTIFLFWSCGIYLFLQ